MKKLLLIATLAMAQSVFASKARVAALQEANHLIDVQTVFTNPAHINSLTPYITFEMGTPQGATAAAEGGFARKLDNGNMLGIYLGHDNTTTLRDGTTYIKQRNPVEVTYGMGNMGFAGSISTTDDKKNGKKETTVVGKYGMQADNMGYWANLSLVSTAEQVTPAQKASAPAVTLGGDYTMGADRFFGKLGYVAGKTEVTPAASVDNKVTGLELGWENQSLKKADADIYYGAKVAYEQTDVGGKKITTMALPVFLGLEYNASSWLIFRGSVRQNFILGSKKDETAANTDAESTAANTSFNGGIGLKYNQLTLDGSLAAQNSGQVNGTAFLSQASVTYNF